MATTRPTLDARRGMEERLRPVRRVPPLYESVQTAIKDYVIRNQLRPGDRLPPEGELARTLRVGRNAVREGVKALASIGLLETRRGSGLFLKRFSFEPLLEYLPYGLLFDLRELEELLEVRRILETGMIRAAIEAMTPERLAELYHTVAAMRVRAGRGEEFPEEDRTFHRALHHNAGNRLLLSLLDSFWVAFHRVVGLADLGDAKPLAIYRDHAVILEAVAKRNVPAARAALDRHYDGLQRRLDRLRASGDRAGTAGLKSHGRPLRPRRGPRPGRREMMR